jgi:hypothetical protein
LPEYRNGGLLIDAGVLVLTGSRTRATHPVGSALVVEWRALTVALLDRMRRWCGSTCRRHAAEALRSAILEGGTWAAGRELAGEAMGASPPLSIISDGTVF